MATVIEYPCQCPLYLPAVLHDLEPLAGVFDHFQIHLVGPFAAAHPVGQPLGLIAGIDPDFPQALDSRSKIALEQCDQAEAIIRIGCCDDDRHDQPQGIDQDMPFASFDFLVPIKADVLPLCRRLDALTISTARGGFGPPALALAFPLAQRVHHASPDTRLSPASEVAIDRVRIPDIRREHAPLAPRFVDVENAVDDAAEVHRLPPWATRAPLGWGQHKLEGLPLRIAHVCGIVTCGAHRCYSLPGLCV